MDITPGIVIGFVLGGLGLLFAGIAIERRSAGWARLGAFVVLGLVALVSLLFAVGEMAGGIAGGAGHLAPVAIVAALALVAVRHERLAGVLSLAFGVLVALFFWAAMPGAWPARVQAILIAGTPFIVAGGLFLVANALSWPHPGPSGAPRHQPG
jgi:hypothetical protein